MLQLSMSESKLAEQTGPWFIPTRLSESEFVKSVPLAFLSDSSIPAELIFNDALTKSIKLFVPKPSRLIHPSGPYGISGIDLNDRKLRKGHPFGIAEWLKTTGGRIGQRAWIVIQQFLEKDGSLWAVADEKSDLGIIWLSETANRARLKNSISGFQN